MSESTGDRTDGIERIERETARHVAGQVSMSHTRLWEIGDDDLAALPDGLADDIREATDALDELEERAREYSDGLEA